MSDIQKIQQEVKVWVDKNFGPVTPSWQPLLGVCEEAGELCHAHLKGVQHIREGSNEQKTKEKKIDAIGDIIIFLMHYCLQEGLDLEECVKRTWVEVQQRDWTEIRQAPFPSEQPAPADSPKPTKPRSICTTVDEMMMLIPDHMHLKRELKRWRDSVFMELPESNSKQWREVAVILGRYIPQTNLEPWQRQLESVWFASQ